MIKWIALEMKGSTNSTCHNFVNILEKNLIKTTVISQKAGVAYMYRLTAEILLD